LDNPARVVHAPALLLNRIGHGAGPIVAREIKDIQNFAFSTRLRPVIIGVACVALLACFGVSMSLALGAVAIHSG